MSPTRNVHTNQSLHYMKKKIEELEKKFQQLELIFNEHFPENYDVFPVALVRAHSGPATNTVAALVAWHIAVNNQSTKVSTAASGLSGNSTTVQPAPKSKAASAIHTAQLSEKLIEAVENENQDDVRKLLTEGADVAYRNPTNGFAALHRAAYNGSVGVAVLLLEAGAPVGAGTDEGRTPLHWAAIKKHFRCAQALIASGADLNARDKSGRTPLHYAASGGDPACVRVLLDAGAGTSIKDNYGLTPKLKF